MPGDMESVLWGIENDPLLRQTMTAVLILDRPPDRETLLDRVERASRTLPLLRHRLVEGPHDDVRAHRRGELVKVNIGRRGFITAKGTAAYVDRLTAAATA